MRGVDAEEEIVSWFRERGFDVDYGTEHFSTGTQGFMDIIASKGKLSFGVEVKSTMFFNTRVKDHKKHGSRVEFCMTQEEQYIGRVAFNCEAIMNESLFCLAKNLKPVIIVLMKPRGRPHLVWYYPFEDVLKRTEKPSLKSFSLSLYEILETGQPAEHYFSHHANNGDSAGSNYRNMRNYQVKEV
nr:hypothetical protein [Candidatus Freyarchaeota archaeon]